MPFKPIIKERGTPKAFGDFSAGEKDSWIRETGRERSGIFGTYAAGRVPLDRENAARCLQFAEELGQALSCEARTAVDALRAELEQESAPTRKRA